MIGPHPAVPPGLRPGVLLGPLTSLELGGPAGTLVDIEDDGLLREVVAWAASERRQVLVLGGGSNLVVADAGVDATVLRMRQRGITVSRSADGDVLLTAAAGEPLDEVVALAAGEGWAGLECLSGIPGTVGAAPVQNVGAYGRELADVLATVRVLDRVRLEVRSLPGTDCGLAYRDSLFRTDPDRWAVLGVTLRLRPGGTVSIRYPELAAELGGDAAQPPAAVRAAVLAVRSRKSMLLAPDDVNHRSAGSFFVNPVVDAEAAARLQRQARVRHLPAPPVFPAAGGMQKVAAAWLVEHAGFPRGTRSGGVGVSSRHALALVHHGGGSAAELVAFAREIRSRVRERFAIDLRPEPVFWGFPTADPTA